MWSSRIQRLLLDASLSSSSTPSATPVVAKVPARSTHHLPGTIWRKFVAKCVLFDLLEQQSKGGTELGGERRRIVRMDELGLGGIVMYSIPQREDWTLEKVFGKDGMEEEDFLNGIQVKIAYTPLYACTSFVTGQVMNAFLRGTDPPVPASAGLGFSAFFNVFESDTPMSNPHHLKRNLKHVPASDCASRFSLEHGVLLSDDEAWVDARTPVATTFPSLSPVSLGTSTTASNLFFTSSNSLDSLEADDTSISSISSESLGPCTPVKPPTQYPRVALHRPESATILFPSSSSQDILLKAMPKNDVGGDRDRGFGRGKENIPPLPVDI